MSSDCSLTQERTTEMVATDINQWDETICNMIACQHPPCWEAMRRIETGHPRILIQDLKSLERHFPETEDELPTLKIFNLPLNYSYRRNIKHAKSSSSLISIKNSRNYSTSPTVVEAISVLSSERNHFPGLNSRVESQSPHYTPISFSTLRQVEKIQVTDLSDLAAPKLDYQPTCGNLIVRWIPDIRHKFLRSERPTTRTRTPAQRMCVKDLALENLLSLNNTNDTNCPNLQKRKKSNKVPTGGQPYLLHLRRNPKIYANKSSSPTDKEKKAVERPFGKRKFFPQNLQLSPLTDAQKKNLIHLEKKKRVLPGGNGSPPIVQKVPAKERGLGRIALQVPSEGSGILKHPVSSQQLNSTALAFQTVEAYGQRNEGECLLRNTWLSQEGPAEKMHLPEYSLQTSQMVINRRRPFSKIMEYKSNRASLFIEGYNSSVHQISKSESKSKQYCKQIAIQKEAALPQDDPSTPQKSEKNAFQSPHTPPPSPFVSECDDSPSQVFI